MSVVVRDVGIQDRGEVAAAEDQDPVGAFAPERADPKTPTSAPGAAQQPAKGAARRGGLTAG
ncbi:MAG TPA: hypothetical protein VJS67_06855 [Pseudonocardiaceae bacterium]|nr:hypothetical protein [Pseudonocardiaceae bacterium]